MFARKKFSWRLGLILVATVLALAGCGPEAYEGT